MPPHRCIDPRLRGLFCLKVKDPKIGIVGSVCGHQLGKLMV
jgi:hypothetical protein